jgi:histidinol phosphatase-like enzyme
MTECMEAMGETQRQTGEAFDMITWCQHHPDAKDTEMAVCWCRKPRSGMIIGSKANRMIESEYRKPA